MTKPREDAPRPDKGISRPDAERADAGQAPFEAQASRHESDRAHGYSQDSGYASSGGKPAEGSAESSGPKAFASPATPTTDEQIRQRVHERLTQNDGILAGDQITIDVEDGIVTLHGEVHNEIQRGELKELISTIPNVRELRSELKLAH